MGDGMRISAFGSKEIQAVILLMKPIKGSLATTIKRATKTAVGPVWEESVRGNAQPDPLSYRVLVATAKPRVTNTNVYLESGNSSKRVRGGATIRELVASQEFGSARDKVMTYRSKRGGTSYSTTRHTQRQLPSRNAKGRIVYPALREAIPRLASLWVQTTIRTFQEILEGKSP